MKLRRLLLAALVFLFAILIMLPALVVHSCRGPLARSEGAPSSPVVRLLLDSGQVLELALEDYVLGVVAGEMPAGFHLEALKAQAVAARTYAVRHARDFGGPGMPDHAADLTADHRTHQAWLSPADMRARWGWLGFLRWWPRLERAVEATRGLVLVYEGQVIEAVYHSTCGGRTEAAQHVWQAAVPYLQSVECPYDSHSPRLQDRVDMPLAAVAERLGAGIPVVAAGRSLLGVVALTPTGRLSQVRFGEAVYSGQEFRHALGLNSTRVQWTLVGAGLRFETVGHGHAVGMCQYGADGLARHGKAFREILAHYYPGTDLVMLSEDRAGGARDGPERARRDSAAGWPRTPLGPARPCG